MTIQTEGFTGWPDGAPGPFFIVINRTKSNEEKILCSSHNGSDLTVLADDGTGSTGRAADQTSAQSHAIGSVVEHILTATDAREANTHVNDTTQHISVGTLALRPSTSLVVGQTYYATDEEILYIYSSSNGWRATTAHPRIVEDVDLTSTYKIKNMVDPTNAQDAATKTWVETTITANTAGSVAAAAASAAAALVSETNAATSATNSSTSAAQSATSAVEAANSAAAAAAALDQFDDRYLGSKSSFPTTDNDGDPLVSGALFYLNTGTSEQIGMYVYDGSGWIKASAAATASIITYEYTATGSQTAFTGNDRNGVSLSFTGSLIQVFLNGVLLSPGNDYTTSTNTVTLASGATAGDEVLVVAFASFSVADTYTQTQANALFATQSELASAGFSPILLMGA
jgi:hypothetical protein